MSHNAPHITPDQLANIRIMYSALRSGKYQKHKGGFFGPLPHHNCAQGVFISEHAGTKSFNEWLAKFPKYYPGCYFIAHTGLTEDFRLKIADLNNRTDATFEQIASFLYDHMLENYALDLDAETPSPAPVEVQHG